MAVHMFSAMRLNWGLCIFLSEFVQVSLRRSHQAAFCARTVLWQGRAARVRARLVRESLTVPPIIIFSKGFSLIFLCRPPLGQRPAASLPRVSGPLYE